MHFAITLTWNGATVLEGKATAVCAHDIARAHIADNFAGPELAAFLARPDTFGAGSLDKLLSAPAGEGLGGVYGDRTGSASYKIKRLVEA